MKTRILLSMIAAVSCSVESPAHGQIHQGRTTPAAQYFMNRQVNATNAAHAAIQRQNHAIARPVQQVGASKPFENVQRQPTLSPYLGLDAVPEGAMSLPNWHTFVQPQLQERRSAEAQARELLRARQQMRVATTHYIMPENQQAGAPVTGSSMQFMNIGNYYPGLR